MVPTLQDSLNNNGEFVPVPPASWQETVLCSPHQEPLRGERVMGAQGSREGRREEGGWAS